MSGTHHVALITGDGIGPEVCSAVQTVLDRSGVKIDWEELPAGSKTFEETGEVLPESTIERIREIGVALKAPMTTPRGDYRSPNVRLRKALDLYANIRPFLAVPGIKCKGPETDLIIVRENTEDLYAGQEFMLSPGVAIGLKVITQSASLRIARAAFNLAKRNDKKVTAVHKSNIMQITDGLFLDSCIEASKEFPEVPFDDRIVDNCVMQMIMRPEQFGVLVTENLYGDILSDAAAGLIGGLGMAPGANMGDHCAVFEAVHGTAPDIAGQGKANPTALLLSAIMMLRHLGENEVSKEIDRAVTYALQTSARTGDIGGQGNTGTFVQAIISRL